MLYLSFFKNCYKLQECFQFCFPNHKNIKINDNYCCNCYKFYYYKKKYYNILRKKTLGYFKKYRSSEI